MQFLGEHFPVRTELSLRRREEFDVVVPSVSGTEDHEPEHAQDQDREAGGDYKQGEHRGTRLGLPRLGRGFDGLTLLSRCHAASISRILDAGCQGNA